MSLLNPSEPELQERHAGRQLELAQRAQKLRQRHRRFIAAIALAGGLLFAFCCWGSSFGGYMGWQMWLLVLIHGALFAGVVGAYALGVFRGMAVYGLGCLSVWLLGMWLGWYRLINTVDIQAAFGPILVFISSLGGLVIAGAVFGFLSDTFDSDTTQV